MTHLEVREDLAVVARLRARQAVVVDQLALGRAVALVAHGHCVGLVRILLLP
eukprot:SAG22_NODE_9155_length_607_cov_0.809055_1_plen_51_part_10